MIPQSLLERAAATLDAWRRRRLDLIAATAAALTLLILLTLRSGQGVRYPFREGDLAPYDIRAPFAFEIVDQRRTAERNARIRAETPAVFFRDPSARDETFRTLQALDDNPAETAASLRLPQNLRNDLADPEERARLLERLRTLLDRAYQRGIVEDHPGRTADRNILLRRENGEPAPASLDDFLPHTPQTFLDLARSFHPSLPAAELQRLATLAYRLAKPDILFDLQATADLVNDRLRRQPPLYLPFAKGQLLVRKGEVLSKEKIALLETVNVRSRRGRLLNSWGLTAFYLILAGLLAYAASVFDPRVLRNRRYALLLILLAVIHGLISLGLPRFDLRSPTSALFLPVLLPTIVLPVFFTSAFSAFALTILLLLSAFLGAEDAFLGVLFLVIGLSGLALRHRFPRRGSAAFWTSGLLMAAAQSLVLLVAGLVQYLPAQALLRLLAFGLLNALFSLLTAFGLVSLLESLFNLAIDARLLELSNLNKPIFRRLLLEAPGTYHHSVLVANLAEAAALDIGANALLAKIAAYYHDIGKLEHPDFFIENTGFEQRLQRHNLDPFQSAAIVKDHLAKSVEMGRRLRLPEEVLELVGQHHGRSLIKFFYYKALATDRPVRREDFTYPGENPKSREAVILLLADSVEAASRSLPDPSPERLHELVEEILNGKFAEGILDESDITLGEVRRIGDAFLKVLNGVFHSRIRYPADHDIEQAERQRLQTSHAS